MMTFLHNLTRPAIVYVFFPLLFIIPISKSLAAGDYREGYIVTNSGDTIHGYVDYEDWVVNPKSILFTLKLGPIGDSFSVEELKAFGVLDKLYQRSPVEIDTSFQKNGSKKITDKVFLKVLVHGDKNLYYLGDERGGKHFFIGSIGKVETLINQVNQREEEDAGSTTITYHEQLISYLSECSSIKDIISLVEYNTNDLIYLLKYHANCSVSRIDYSMKITGAKLEWALIGGPVLTGLNVVGNNRAFAGLIDVDFSKSVRVALGVSCNALFPMKGMDQVSFNMELMYHSYMVNGIQYSSERLDVGFSYINWNLMLRYYYPVNDYNVFANAGLSLGYVLSMTNANPSSSTGEAIKNPSKTEYGYSLGLGGEYSKYSLELRYERRNGVMTQPDVAAITSRVFLIFGYKLGKSKRRKY